jgi:hypothetical protein
MPAFARSLVRFFRACASLSLLACLPTVALAATFQNPILAGFKPGPLPFAGPCRRPSQWPVRFS